MQRRIDAYSFHTERLSQEEYACWGRNFGVILFKNAFNQRKSIKTEINTPI